MAVAPIKVIKQRHINEIWKKKIKICFSYADFVFSALYIFRRSYSNNCSDGSFPWKTKIFWETWNRSRWAAVQPLCYIFTKSILHFDQLSLGRLSLPKIFWETWNRSHWAVQTLSVTANVNCSFGFLYQIFSRPAYFLETWNRSRWAAVHPLSVFVQIGRRAAARNLEKHLEAKRKTRPNISLFYFLLFFKV